MACLFRFRIPNQSSLLPTTPLGIHPRVMRVNALPLPRALEFFNRGRCRMITYPLYGVPYHPSYLSPTEVYGVV